MNSIGIDMIEVERIARKIQKNQGFRELVFSAGEIAYCESKTNSFEHYAARFAAKEAFLKAVGTGWTTGAFNEIEILPDAAGKPCLTLLGETAKAWPGIEVSNISVSLTHLKTFASAVVLIEK